MKIDGDLFGCMYDSDGARVGDGQQQVMPTLSASGVYWTVGVGLGEFCTADETLRAGVGHDSGTGITGQCTDNTGAVTYKDSGWGGGTMPATFNTATNEMEKAIGWKFSWV